MNVDSEVPQIKATHPYLLTDAQNIQVYRQGPTAHLSSAVSGKRMR